MRHSFWVTALIAGLLAAPAVATPPQPEPSNITRLPEVVVRKAPLWPSAAPFVCQGLLLVYAKVDTGGAVVDTRLDPRRHVECPDSVLIAAVDSAAVQAVRSWNFTPAESVGTRVPLWITIPFRLARDFRRNDVVVGCVRDSLSGKPLISANVIALGTRMAVMSDETGWFALAGLPEGHHRLKALAPCYEPRLHGATVGQGYLDRVNFALPPIRPCTAFVDTIQKPRRRQ